MARHRRCRRTHIEGRRRIGELYPLRRRMTAMHVVEVHISVATLGETFSSMRRWLDHNHCTPVNFDYAFYPPEEVVIKFAFEKDDLAEIIQQDFEEAEWISPVSPAR